MKTDMLNDNKRSIIFTARNENNEEVEMLRIASDGFFMADGQEIKDAGKLYERFMLFLDQAGVKK